MTDYFVSKASTSSDSNDGLTENTAFLTVSRTITDNAIAAAGNRIRLRCGDTFDECVNDDDDGMTIAGSGWTMDCFGDGDLPLITRALRAPTWVTADHDLWMCQLAGNYGGIALEDGRPMRPVEWTTNLATTAALMVAGDMVFDAANWRYYIRPSSGDPSKHTYVVSAGAKVLNASSKSNITIRNIAWEIAGQGPFFYGGTGVSNLLIEDCYAHFIGGWYGPGGVTIQGDGITVAGNVGADGPIVVRRSTFEDIFDAAFLPQQWENDTAMRGVLIDGCIARRCGQYGFGASVIGGSLTNSSIRNVVVRNCYVEDMARGYSGNRGGIAYASTMTTTDANSALEGIVFSCNRARRGEMGSSRTNSSGVTLDCEFMDMRSRGVFVTRTRPVDMIMSGIVVGPPYEESSTRSGVWHNGDNANSGVYVHNSAFYGPWVRGNMTNHTAGVHRIYNSIFVGNITGVHRNAAGTTSTSHCCFHGNGTNTSSVTNTSPLLADPELDASGRPAAGSPVYGAGLYIPGAKHFGGHEMSVVSPDIGAFRYFARRELSESRASVG